MLNFHIKILSVLLVLTSVNPSVAADKKSLKVEALTQQSDVVWGFDFLTKDKIIFSLRGGALKVLDLKKKSVVDVTGAPKVRAEGQGGLLDVRVHYKDKSKIYLTYSEKLDAGKTTTALGYGRLVGNKLENFKKIFSALEPNTNDIHFGSRIEFDQKGHVFIAVGDRRERSQAQDLKYHMGSVIRLNEDGGIPKDNPFVNKKDARPEIWSYGHRSPQGLQFRPGTDELWESEMGPRGGDEVNLILKAKNYGWPEVTYGKEYWGPSIGVKERKDTVQPLVYWVPSISPSALHFYTGDKYPNWKENLFLACLSGQQLRRLVLDGNKVVQQEELLKELNLRFRNLRTGPDGYLYVSTDDGKIGRLVLK